jgi:hypothetical protein
MLIALLFHVDLVLTILPHLVVCEQIKRRLIISVSLIYNVLVVTVLQAVQNRFGGVLKVRHRHWLSLREHLLLVLAFFASMV